MRTCQNKHCHDMPDISKPSRRWPGYQSRQHPVQDYICSQCKPWRMGTSLRTPRCRKAWISQIPKAFYVVCAGEDFGQRHSFLISRVFSMNVLLFQPWFLWWSTNRRKGVLLRSRNTRLHKTGTMNFQRLFISQGQSWLSACTQLLSAATLHLWPIVQHCPCSVSFWCISV